MILETRRLATANRSLVNLSTEMTYTVSSGTLNPSIPYHTISSKTKTKMLTIKTMTKTVLRNSL